MNNTAVKNSKENTTSDYDQFAKVLIHILVLIVVASDIRFLIGRCLYEGNYYLPIIERTITPVESWTIFGVMILINMIVFFSLLEERDWTDSVFVSFIPSTISLLIYYHNSYILFSAGYIMFLSIFSIAALIMVSVKRKSAEKGGKRINEAKLFKVYFGAVYRYMGYVSAFVVIVMCILVKISPVSNGTRTVFSNVKPEYYDYSAPDGDLYALLDENREALMVLKTGNYEYASEEERLDGLQTLLNIECAYFQIPVPQLRAVDFELDSTAGDFSSIGYYINISNDCVMSESSLFPVSTVLHEGRHAYQYETVSYAKRTNMDLSLSVNTEIREWSENYDTYYEFSSNGSLEEYQIYSSQPIERDAMCYGDYVGVLVCNYINNW